MKKNTAKANDHLQYFLGAVFDKMQEEYTDYFIPFEAFAGDKKEELVSNVHKYQMRLRRGYELLVNNSKNKTVIRPLESMDYGKPHLIIHL